MDLTPYERAAAAAEKLRRDVHDYLRRYEKTLERLGKLAPERSLELSVHRGDVRCVRWLLRHDTPLPGLPVTEGKIHEEIK